mgnify:CR=1 FL=1
MSAAFVHVYHDTAAADKSLHVLVVQDALGNQPMPQFVTGVKPSLHVCSDESNLFTELVKLVRR